MRIGIDTIFENPRRPTGATGYLKLLIAGMAKLDHENDYFLFVSPANRSQFEELVGLRWTLIECPYSNESIPGRIASQQLLIPRYARRHRLDVLNSPGNTSPVVLPCPSVLTIKTLHHLHRAPGLGLTRTLYRRLMVQKSARAARLIIANSNDTAQRIEESLGIPHERIRVVYEAVASAFTPGDATGDLTETLAWRHGIHRDYVLFVSTLWRYKNADGLLRSFAQIADRFVGTDVVIAGRDHGGYRAELESLSTELGIRERVIFLDHVPNDLLPDLYRGARVFVYPSLEETFGLTLVEAMKCGVPIIASSTSSIPEILGGAGVLITPTEPAQLSTALAAVLSDERLRESLIAKGFARGSDFTPERMAGDTLNVLLEAAA